MELHTLALDKAAGSLDQFEQRTLKNYENRCLYHHVFDVELVEKMCAHLGLTVITQSSTEQNWIVLLSAYILVNFRAHRDLFLPTLTQKHRIV